MRKGTYVHGVVEWARKLGRSFTCREMMDEYNRLGGRGRNPYYILGRSRFPTDSPQCPRADRRPEETFVFRLTKDGKAAPNYGLDAEYLWVDISGLPLVKPRESVWNRF